MEKRNQLQQVMKDMPNGDEKLQVLEDWIAEAEEASDFDWSYMARLAQNEVAVNVGRYDLLMDNFSWCLDRYEEQPSRYDEKRLLRQFTWFLRYLHYFPGVTTEEMNDYYGYFHTLLVKNNYSLRSYDVLEANRALDSGQTEKAVSFLLKWKEEERDEMSDCEWCEKQLEMRILFENGQLKEAFSVGEALLHQSVWCEHVPHTLYPHLLQPSLYADRTDEADVWQEQGYFLIRQKPNRLLEVSRLLVYLSATHIEKAKTVFFEHIEMADDCTDLHTRFHFYLAAWCFLEKAEEEGLYLPDDDAAWFAEQVPAIAGEFDERNKNHYYANTILDWRQDVGLG